MNKLVVLAFLFSSVWTTAQPAGYTYTKPVTIESLVKRVNGTPVEANVWTARDKDGAAYFFTIIPNKKGVLARKRIYKK